MNWFEEFQVFLFDFDGLLVNTEWLHREAYVRLCARHGHILGWSFAEYATAAHQKAPKEALLAVFPELKKHAWEDLYEEKCAIFTQLLQEGHTRMMPGAEKLLGAVAAAKIPHAVVTNSRKSHLDIIRSQLPQLETIPHWITRECYSHAKPHPECYEKAIDMLAKPEDKIVGFEDTPRGLAALKATRAQPVLVADPDYPLLAQTLDPQVIHLSSLELVERPQLV